ncbi:MAG: hypothetical protein M1374_08455 [Firmicutes bacterium]|nr:hypothetical protein [Bacillota bacterium]
MTKHYKNIWISRTSVAIALAFIVTVAAACSSGSSGASGSNSAATTKPANAMALITNAYNQGIKAQNIDLDTSMSIAGSGLFQGSSSSGAKTLKAILPDISKFNINIAASKSSGSNSLTSGTEMFSVNYSSTQLATIILTFKHSAPTSAYLKVNIAAIGQLPLPYPPQTKKDFPLIGTLIQPTWYKIPGSIVSQIETLFVRLETRANSSTAQANSHLNIAAIRPVLINLLTSYLTKGGSTTITSNQGGEEIRFSSNLQQFLPWFLTSGMKDLVQLNPSIKQLSQPQIAKLKTALKKIPAAELRSDAFTTTMQITSANTLTSFNENLKVVNPKKQSQYIMLGLTENITYPNTPIALPTSAVSLPQSLLGALSQSLTKATSKA